MSELLTARQVQDLLKVDRTTIYRMLDDGRLTGVKVGHQWRFSSQEVQSILSGARSAGDPSGPKEPIVWADMLPLHCIQPVQNVFAEVANIGAVTTSPDGEPLTKISNSCRFCELILASESGRKGCVASWRRLSATAEAQPNFVTCHAGLQYARARIEIDGDLVAMLVAGQFHASEADREAALEQVGALAAKYGIDAASLMDAAQGLPILDERKRTQISLWLKSVARTFEQIGSERAELLGRLQRIAEMSTLAPTSTVLP
ncbi:MAG: PocR ligand-binding domain-containing protein [Thermoflexales bacterium]|nr:PocR ligand-binding domain-containing protein [Thermoflexales bacterium]MBP8241978.1 PocR ligand-binding domain-containing protein [Thermoflexales bacterium]